MAAFRLIAKEHFASMVYETQWLTNPTDLSPSDQSYVFLGTEIQMVSLIAPLVVETNVQLRQI